MYATGVASIHRQPSVTTRAARALAGQLGISARTVANHVASILAKLNVDSRAAAATRAPAALDLSAAPAHLGFE